MLALAVNAQDQADLADTSEVSVEITQETCGDPRSGAGTLRCEATGPVLVQVRPHADGSTKVGTPQAGCRLS